VRCVGMDRERLSEEASALTQMMQQSELTGKKNRKKSAEMTDSTLLLIT
jgi:hypothetical protein